MSEEVKKVLKTIASLAIIIGLAYLLSFFATQYLIASIPIDGHSMEPTIHDGDRAVVYRLAEPKYGDIVIFYSALDSKYLVKRVIGLAGDTIEVKREGSDSYVFRNGEKLIEPYINEEMDYIQDEVVVGEGQFYYLGDNRNFSSDSHYGNLGDMEQIVGVVFLRANIGNFDFSFI